MAIEKEDAYAELYKQLATTEGNKIIYKIAKKTRIEGQKILNCVATSS